MDNNNLHSGMPVLGIPASTQEYLRPWQNPELAINPQLHQHTVTIQGLKQPLGVVCAGPGAFARVKELTDGRVNEKTHKGLPTDVILFLVTPPALNGKKGSVCAMMTYADFEAKMDELELDSVTTPGFYPYWLEALTGNNMFNI